VLPQPGSRPVHSPPVRLNELFRPEANHTLWLLGNDHPEARRAGYHLDSEQCRRGNDNIPCSIRDGNRYSRSRFALQSYAGWLRTMRTWFSWSLIARYWKEPHKFMPDRFLGDWPRDAFVPFSQGTVYIAHHMIVLISHKHFAGARACLGRRCELL
jgi:hypothetical protein